MDCREFYRVLEGVMEGEPAPEALAHAEHCPACSALVQELRLITHESRLLGEHEPPPQVWETVQRQLEAEGLITSEGWLERLWAGLGRFAPFSPTPALGAVYALVLLLGLTLVLAEFRLPERTTTAGTLYNAMPAVEKAAFVNGYDQELEQLERAAMQRFASTNPELHAAYEANLATINESIHTCHHTLQQDPDDRSTRKQLYAAYQQKAVVLQSLLDPDLGM